MQNLGIIQSLKGNLIEKKAIQILIQELPHYSIEEAEGYLDESDVSVYKDVIDNKIYMIYYLDDLPGSDANLFRTTAYENQYILNFAFIKNG